MGKTEEKLTVVNGNGSLPPIPARQRGLRRGGGRTGPNKATQDIKALARAWTLEDPEWVTSARARMKSGDANHLETYLLQMAYGKPKEDAPPSLPPGTTVNILALLGAMPVEKLRELTAKLDGNATERG